MKPLEPLGNWIATWRDGGVDSRTPVKPASASESFNGGRGAPGYVGAVAGGVLFRIDGVGNLKLATFGRENFESSTTFWTRNFDRSQPFDPTWRVGRGAFDVVGSFFNDCRMLLLLMRVLSPPPPPPLLTWNKENCEERTFLVVDGVGLARSVSSITRQLE